MSSPTPLAEGRQPPHSTVTGDLVCSVCLMKPSGRNRMAELFRCGNNPEYDEFMGRVIGYAIRTRGIEAFG